VGEGEDEGAKIKNVHFNITLTSILSHQGRGGKWIPLDTAQLAGRRFIPQIKNSYINCVMERSSGNVYHVKNEFVDLQLIQTKNPLLEGGTGFLDLHSKTTYYYSFTNMRTTGMIKIKNDWINVSGKSWMDHQWADAGYSKDKWDWFSIQLDNDTEIVSFVYDNGINTSYFADICYPDGRQEHCSDVEIIPLAVKWQSQKSKAVYPLEWQLRIPSRNITLNLKARMENNEMLFGSINYWEGPLSVTGSSGSHPVKGLGFMELVGYPSRYNAMKYVGDETYDMANLLVSSIRNKLFFKWRSAN
jgi:predicted secreted hydrolase